MASKVSCFVFIFLIKYKIYLDVGEATTASRLLQKAGRLKDSRRRKDSLSFKENENDKIENRVSRLF